MRRVLPSLLRYDQNTGVATELLWESVNKLSLNFLQKETGLSRNTIIRVRRGERVHARSLQLDVEDRDMTFGSLFRDPASSLVGIFFERK
jgi:hypothetical protein